MNNPLKTDPKDVLVLLACSGRKRDGEHLLIDLYDGPMWQTLRLHLGAIPKLNVFVLSAKLGFQQAAFYTAIPYDEKISEKKTQRLIDRGANAPNDKFGSIKPGCIMGPSAITTATRWNAPYQAVLIGGSGFYRSVFDAWLPAFIIAGVITEDAPILHVSGGIGEQRGQLGAWLRAYQPQPLQEAAELFTSKTKTTIIRADAVLDRNAISTNIVRTTANPTI